MERCESLVMKDRKDYSRRQLVERTVSSDSVVSGMLVALKKVSATCKKMNWATHDTKDLSDALKLFESRIGALTIASGTAPPPASTSRARRHDPGGLPSGEHHVHQHQQRDVAAGPAVPAKPESAGQHHLGREPGRAPGSVAPSQNVTFNFNAVPATNGTLDFQWRMAEGTTSFGASTPNVAVAVDGTENAQFISQVVPTSMGPGQTQLMRITMQNTGQTTWTTAGGFQLGSQSPPDNTTWGPSRVALPHSVSPGQSVVFTFPVTAPTSTGSYDFQWRMVQGATWFGDASTNTSIGVQTQTSTVGYIHVDRLNTPRAVFDSNLQLRWKWEQQEPFGVNAPDETHPRLAPLSLR